MKQVTQTLRTGVIEVRDVPIPTISDGFILVQNNASVISAGTEKTKIDIGKKNLLQKARSRPDLVKQVIKKLKNEGIKKTLTTVNSRLDSPSPLGYSCAGGVIAIGGQVEGIQPGDRVACGGADYANHADFVSIPKNLVVRVPENVSDEEAAFTTIGSIAMQGLRLAEPKLGETFLVIGLGLIGQISVQLLRANGCNVIGTDLDSRLVDRAAENYNCTPSSPDNLPEICSTLTSGNGVDGVLICAGTSSNQPIEISGQVTRQKGRVVVVGAVRMDIPRDDFFKKEINVVISRSYGPGRYDPNYEEAGHDYPYGYVRFTEKRNMESFLSLLSQKKIEVNSLITHRFKLDQAATAYDLIEGKRKEPYLGIVLSYNHNPNTLTSNQIIKTSRVIHDGDIKLSFLGAGNYATASLLPHLKSNPNVTLAGLSTSSGRTAESVAKKFEFQYCSSSLNSLLSGETNVIVIATRHDTHADSVVESLKRNIHTYVEKPLALTIEQLDEIHKAFTASEAQLMVGFNRRFSPLTGMVRTFFENVVTPLVINIRINAGIIPADHWIQNPVVGGGRIIGEGCHFFDLSSTLANSLPLQVHAISTSSPQKSPINSDDVHIQLKFQNGSIANICYTSSGSQAQSKEYIEVFGGGKSAIINDFKSVSFFTNNSKSYSKKLHSQDKGQSAMLKAWIDGLRSGEPCIDYESLILNSMATILAVDSLRIGMPIPVTYPSEIPVDTYNA